MASPIKLNKRCSRLVIRLLYRAVGRKPSRANYQKFDPSSSAESSPGSRLDTRLKVRLARLQLEEEELELRKLEADIALKMRQLALQSGSVRISAAPHVPHDSAPAFDVSTKYFPCTCFL